MRLTFHTDYALRMLIHLEINRGSPIRVADVADSFGISRNHLLKVALKLGKLGYLATTRGRTGGIMLARDAEDINLGEVIRHMEDGFDLTECMRRGGFCAITPACRLKGVVARALDAFLSVFDGFTLADIAAHRNELRELLEMNRTWVKAEVPVSAPRGE
ncbi:MAG: Rrf2 family transcriptional regulator [Rhizobiaceae bacterium]